MCAWQYLEKLLQLSAKIELGQLRRFVPVLVDRGVEYRFTDVIGADRSVSFINFFVFWTF